MDSPPDEMELLCDALGVTDPTQVRLISREPLGDGSVAGFDVIGTGDADATYYVDTSRRRVPRETGMLVGTPEQPEARVWLHPADPHLPALAPVAFSGAVQGLLARLGMHDAGAPVMVTYRPGRRAVLRVPVAGAVVWAKVVPPSRVGAIVSCYDALATAGVPIPALHGWSEDGLIIGEAARGTPASDVAWTPDDLLDGVDDLRERIAGAVLGRAAPTRLARRRDWYTARLTSLLPEERAAQAERVARRVRQGWGEETPVPIHGDLHFGQLFLDDGGRVVSVIDVDTAGVGQPSEDTAAFLAHAVASALLTPPPRDARVWALAQRALERWNSDDVRVRAATHLLGHALGAYEFGDTLRGQRLLDAAERVASGESAAVVADGPAPKSGLIRSFDGA